MFSIKLEESVVVRPVLTSVHVLAIKDSGREDKGRGRSKFHSSSPPRYTSSRRPQSALAIANLLWQRVNEQNVISPVPRHLWKTTYLGHIMRSSKYFYLKLIMEGKIERQRERQLN